MVKVTNDPHVANVYSWPWQHMKQLVILEGLFHPGFWDLIGSSTCCSSQSLPFLCISLSERWRPQAYPLDFSLSSFIPVWSTQSPGFKWRLHTDYYFILASGTSSVLLLLILLISAVSLYPSIWTLEASKLSPWTSLYPLSSPFDLLSCLTLNDVCILMTLRFISLGWLQTHGPNCQLGC